MLVGWKKILKDGHFGYVQEHPLITDSPTATILVSTKWSALPEVLGLIRDRGSQDLAKITQSYY